MLKSPKSPGNIISIQPKDHLGIRIAHYLEKANQPELKMSEKITSAIISDYMGETSRYCGNISVISKQCTPRKIVYSPHGIA